MGAPWKTKHRLLPVMSDYLRLAGGHLYRLARYDCYSLCVEERRSYVRRQSMPRARMEDVECADCRAAYEQMERP